jgi:hypothetical protein
MVWVSVILLYEYTLKYVKTLMNLMMKKGLRSNDLGANPYLTFALSAMSELLASLFTFKLLEFRSRRKPYFVLILIAGFSCTTVYFSSNVD